MITQKVLNILKGTVENEDFWRSARFSYGGSTDHFIKVENSRWRKFLSAFDFCFHVAYATFMLVRYIQYTYLNSYGVADDKLKMIIEYFFVVTLVPNLCRHSLFFLREEAVASFFSQFISYYSSIGKG